VLISGEEEAALDYCWATFPQVPPAPFLVVDSGGGSTQAILGEGPTPVSAHSLPVGAGNMTKQFLAHDPPTKEELEALQVHTSSLVDTLPLVLAPQSAVLMGGSADHLLQFSADPKQHRLTQDDLHHALHTLQKHTAQEIANYYECREDRARLIAAAGVRRLTVLPRYGRQKAYGTPNGILGVRCVR